MHEQTFNQNGAESHSIKAYIRYFLVLLIFLLTFVIVIAWAPGIISLPSGTSDDLKKEDLSRMMYPSTTQIKWRPYFIKPEDRLEKLFGKDWPYIARFNRVDRHHAYPGVTIKVPENIEDIKNYNPIPVFYEHARGHAKYILLDITEQWLGAYEFGKLKLSVPAATGIPDHPTPTGVFRINAFDRHHASSLYKIKDREEQYPMDYALRFHIEDGISFWIHARDLPGKPASHGCVGLFCEPMQKRTYGAPDNPILDDAAALYNWVLSGRDENEPTDTGQIENGPILEIRGDSPVYASRPGTV